MRNLMREKQINWCSCKDHNASDWTVVADFYARHFIPNAWVLECCTIDCHEDGRILYITGKCDHCGGFMRSGTSVPSNIKGDELLAYVYREMEHFRPYDGHNRGRGTYHGCIDQRCRWYQQQDDLTLEARNEQFLRLFRAEEQATVKKWLARNHGAEPYTKPRRDRKSTLLQRILEAARADGAIAEAEAILDYILPNDILLQQGSGRKLDVAALAESGEIKSETGGALVSYLAHRPALAGSLCDNDGPGLFQCHYPADLLHRHILCVTGRCLVRGGASRRIVPSGLRTGAGILPFRTNNSLAVRLVGELEQR